MSGRRVRRPGRPVVVVDYDPEWPRRFQVERDRILTAIGDWTTAIEHVGSTAVPGLAAKPIIDVMIGIRRLADAVHCICPLEDLGYEYVPSYEDEMPFRRYFRKDDDEGSRVAHVHMVEPSHPFWERHLAFRDWLRTHPEDARAYADLKRELAVRYRNDRLAYTEAKTDFIRRIERRAGVPERVEGDG